VRAIYFGSSSFSVPSLNAILPLVCCIVTRKAKPKGRGYRVEANDVKKIGLEAGIPVIEIDSFREEAARELLQYAPVILVVASFGLIVPRWVLEIASVGPINVHPSLLPRYRGPSPIQWALWNGEKETGITFIRMNEKMDEGNILFQEPVAIEAADNAITLTEKLAERAGEIMPGFIEEIRDHGMGEGIVQSSEEATYTPIITKEMGRIDWSLGALEVSRQIRALVSWPTAYAHLDGQVLKVFDGSIYDSASNQ
jgi:methionyl-tRNA formyltransferase